MLDQMFKEDPDNIPDSWVFDDDEETASESSQPQDTDGVPPAGYDHDFWDPLLEEHLGGSDAVEVMAGIKVPKTAPPANAFRYPLYYWKRQCLRSYSPFIGRRSN